MKKNLLVVFIMAFFIFFPEITLAKLPPGNTSPKKGVGLGWDVGTEEQINALGASWAYNWTDGNRSQRRLKERSYEWVPMLKNISGEYTEEKIASTAAFRRQNNLNHYWLIFNEPDYIQQQNITPEEGARKYKEIRELIKRYEPEAKLIVGNVFYTDMGWLKNFRGKYYEIFQTWPEVEGWGVHLYMGWSDYNRDVWRQKMLAVKNWMSPNGGQKELWLTEFGSLNSEQTGRQIMEDQVPWLESQSWITRYAWFATYANGPGCGTCTGSLLLPDSIGGGLSPLGQLYASFGQPPPPTPTPTPTPSAGPKILNLLVKMKGVNAKPGLAWQRAASFKVRLGQQETSASGTVNEQGVWTIETPGLNFASGIYSLYIKGPKHLQKKFANITLTNAAEQTIDLTRQPAGDLSPGDLPDASGVQDGVVNSLDAVYLTGCFATPEEVVCLTRADLNLDGMINTLDMELMNETVLSKWEDEVE